MLKIHIEKQESWDEENSEFIYTKAASVRLEHSLISVSKWEAIWEKSFLPASVVALGMTGQEEEESYIECMIIGEVPDHIPATLLRNYAQTIREYIEKKHSATTIHRMYPLPQSRQIITNELIYYWMLKFGIPFECQRWHFNRLLMLIDVCSVKETSSGKSGKLSSKEVSDYMLKVNRERQSA